METMPLSEVMDAMSGDYDVPVRDIEAPMTEMTWGGPCTHHEPLTCIEHAREIAEDMRVNGWTGPPVFVVGGELVNGHHRTLAAMWLGLDEVPCTEDWSESQGDHDD